jgi:hypothetical protein
MRAGADRGCGGGRRTTEAVSRDGIAHIFRLPACIASVRIVSRAGSPAELGLARDPRVLGVSVRQIVLRQRGRFRVIETDDSSLADGFMDSSRTTACAGLTVIRHCQFRCSRPSKARSNWCCTSAARCSTRCSATTSPAWRPHPDTLGNGVSGRRRRAPARTGRRVISTVFHSPENRGGDHSGIDGPSIPSVLSRRVFPRTVDKRAAKRSPIYAISAAGNPCSAARFYRST